MGGGGWAAWWAVSCGWTALERAGEAPPHQGLPPGRIPWVFSKAFVEVRGLGAARL